MSTTTVGEASKAVEGQGKPSEELNLMIDDLLNDLSNKFMGVAAEITAKMDDMARRIDNLEASIRSQQSEEDTKQEP